MSNEENNNRTPSSNDSRFAGVYSDPKFKDTKAKKYKIKLDDRFSKKDLEFKKKAKVDKYGRRIKHQENKDEKDFDKYFEREEEEVKSSDDGEKKDPATKVATVDRARGEVPSDYVSSSEEETSSESEGDSEDSDLESDESEIEIEDTKPEAGDASKTLAVVNLDWDHVKSTDLMITFASFVPKGGEILRIAIYPSEFGKQRMQKEEVEGPPRELFQSKKSKKKSKKEDDSDSDLDVKDLYEEGDAEKDYDMKSLRRYQLERLRYYYGVVYCNSIATAEAIYKNCDSTEFESSANMFDLRYVPDEMQFDDEPRDECDKIPKNYTPSQFSTDALQHSKVKLTWDETPADRVQIAKRAFTQREIDDMDFKAYLASDTDDSEEEPNEGMKSKLKALVSESIQVGNKSIFDQDQAANESDVDMEITFTPGLAEAGQEEKSDDNEETTIEKVRRKEKERRKMRKDRVKELKKNSENETKQRSKSKRHEPISTEDSDKVEKSKAELELLMMDDGDDEDSKLNKKAHFNMKEILRSEKEQGKKSKFQKRERIVEDEFKPDLNDPRFSEVFEDRDFAIDPSQPEFKGTSAMKQILKERSQRSKNQNKKRKVKQATVGDDGKANLNSLVAKFQRKNTKSKRK